MEAGGNVTAVARREEIARVLRTRGPVLRDEKGERTVRGHLEVFVEPPPEGAYDFILLATPPNGVEAAARDTAHLLASGGAMVVLQNGLCEELVYRGFAINSLRSRRLSPWLAIPIAAIPFVFQHGLKSLDQFWWFATWGVVFGLIFVFTRKLYVNIVIHWLVILSAVLAVLQTVR